MKKIKTTAVALLNATVMSGMMTAYSDAPAFNNLRYEENSAAYKDVESSGLPGSLKYIPIGDSDSAFLSLGGQARVRWEMWDNFGFAPMNDDDFGLLRLRLHGDAHFNENIRMFVEAKSALSTDRDLPGGARTLDVDELALQNAFIDLSTPVGDTAGTLRLGRQELSYGAQRLISPLDWSNTRRTWDGGRVIFNNEAWQFDVFATQFVPVKKYDFNEPDSDSKFFGAYFTGSPSGCEQKFDAYLLRLDRDNLGLDDASFDDERYTAGARTFGKCPITGIDMDIEGGYQFGDRGSSDIKAWFAAVSLTYVFEEIAMKPGVFAGYDYASGDSDPTDGDAETFNQLFPLGHAYLGSIDIIGRQNIEDVSFGFSFWPVEKKVLFKVAHHTFRRAESEDALYNAGGGVVRPGDAGDSRDVGSEVDVTLTYKVSREVNLTGGYSHFDAGDFIAESGPSSDIDFGFVSAQYTF